MEINSPQLSQSLLQKKKYTHGFPRQDCDKSCNDAETVRKFATILEEHQKAVDPKQCMANVSAIRLQESSTTLRTGANWRNRHYDETGTFICNIPLNRDDGIHLPHDGGF